LPPQPAAQAATPGRLGPVLRPIIEKRIADGTFQLPAFPLAAARVLELIKHEEVDTIAISRTLERDPNLAAQTLRAANTFHFGGGVPAKTIRQAVVRLGRRQLQSLLVTAFALPLFDRREPELAGLMKMLRDHSVAVSILARDLASVVGCHEVEEAYLAGLLHDIGKIIIMVFLLETMRLQRGQARRVILHREDVDGVIDLHRPIGLKIVESWKLPDYITHVVRDSTAYDPEHRVSPGNLVFFANALAKREKICLGEPDPVHVTTMILMGQSILGIDAEVANQLCSDLRERVDAS
jgi:putative nucleotidyltransferase with HDIG domain